MHAATPVTDAQQRTGDASYVSVYLKQPIISADFFKDNHCPITLFATALAELCSIRQIHSSRQNTSRNDIFSQSMSTKFLGTSRLASGSMARADA